MMKGEKGKSTFRWLKDRFPGIRNIRPRSDKLDVLAPGEDAPSEQSTADVQQAAARNIQQEDQTEVLSSQPPQTANESTSAALEVQIMDISGWDGIWREAYKKVHEDPKHAKILAKLEIFLEKGEANTGDEESEDLANDLAPSADNGARLKTIQKIAQEKLKTFEEGKLSFTIGDMSFVVRDSIIKAVDVINAFKPIVSGVVAAEPAAALAWAGIATALPILESIFQQDENAATGLTEITFLMTRYQRFHEPEFTSELQSTSSSAASQERLDSVKNELISIYADFYVYEARFILEYATRTKMHRVLRNVVDADQWKKMLSDIRSKSRRIDDGVRDEIGVKTIEMWKKIKDIEISNSRIESLQQDTLKAVLDVDRRQLLQSLKVTGNAIFDSRETSSTEVPCLPGTQLPILKTIQDWAEDPAGTMIFWLEGMAGTGKTSISMSVARALKEGKPFDNRFGAPNKAFLGGSFFFNHGDTTRNNTVELFTTIAWCLSSIFSDSGSPIIQAIRDNPGIETKSPQEQFRKLIADPLASLDKSTFMPFQLIVVIDALDECNSKDAEILLGMLEVLESLGQVRLRLFVTSRREGHISTAFKSLPSHLYRTVRLEKIELSPGEDDDITLYISKTLEKLSKKYCVKDGGVSTTDIKKLVKKADGLFIYAVTACRFLDGFHFCDKELRDEGLSLIFQDQEGPQEEVDGIYLKVLEFPYLNISGTRLREMMYAEMSRLLGFIVVLMRPVSAETLCALLPKERGKLDLYLGHLHPILNVPDDSKVPIHLIHLSFRDFILNEKRPAALPFSIKEIVMHRDIFGRCIEIMNSGLHHNMCYLELAGTFVCEVDSTQIDAHIPQHLRYACLHWVKHLSKIYDGQEDSRVVYMFLQEKLLYWLEVLAFIGETPSIIPIISQLEGLIHPSEVSGLWSLVRDARIFIQSNRWIIEHAPLQIYCSAILFCSGKSQIRSHYQHLIPEWITTKPNTQGSQNAEVSTLHGHSQDICDVSFSPTEALLASVSDDGTTRVWDYIRGTEQHRFQGPGQPQNVCFSRDGLRLASSYLDGRICVRNLKKATEVSLSCGSFVQQLAFSPTDSSTLAAYCYGGTLRIWNLDDKQQDHIEHDWIPERFPVFSFSPNGESIAVCAENWIAVFDLIQGRRVSDFRTLDRAYDVAFSVDSRILAVRLDDTIDFWDVTSPEPKLTKSYGASSVVHSFLRLPTNEDLKIQQSPSGEFELFEKSSNHFIGKFQRKLGGASCDGQLVADITSAHPVIRVISHSSTVSLGREEDSAPENVQLLEDSMALSYDQINVTNCWNVEDGSSRPVLGSVRSIKVSPDGDFVLLQLNKGDEFHVWRKGLRNPQATFNNMIDIVFVPRTAHLATLSFKGELQTLKWDAQMCSFNPISSFSLGGVVFDRFPDTPYGKPRTLYLSPTGQEAIVKFDGPNYEIDKMSSCQLWSFPRKEKVKEIFLSDIRDVTFSPGNEFFGVEYHHGNAVIKLFHTSSGDEVEDCDMDCYADLTFHPVDLTFAVSAYFDNIIAIWEGFPWIKKLQLELSQGSWVRNLALSAAKVAALSKLGGRSIVDIWSTATGQKVYSQAFGFPGEVDFFNFSTKEGFIESNRGRIPLPMHLITTSTPDQQWESLHKCLYVLDEWVMQGHERLLWIPAEYRPRSSLYTGLYRNIDVRGGMICLAHKNNSAVFIGVALERTPVAERYMRLNS